jgi:hypothetical protein
MATWALCLFAIVASLASLRAVKSNTKVSLHVIQNLTSLAPGLQHKGAAGYISNCRILKFSELDLD